ncbi:hypothetical protein BpHYR1_019339 [Brachionus plicatilis]|uniref:Uncharacterized protein n=1 Tax=Brachionus plicatilis TaxID=10195 RepID=A0A3M7QH74_BRAPC|nr:hypothetical protein BpHYR1_019339 [Brachionus plicatilis]
MEYFIKLKYYLEQSNDERCFCFRLFFLLNLQFLEKYLSNDELEKITLLGINTKSWSFEKQF